jgi:hypothetical protein
MKNTPKIRTLTLVAALAAVTATAWATNESLSNAQYVPANTSEAGPRQVWTPDAQVTASESLEANEAVVSHSETTTATTPAAAPAAPAPVVERSVARDPITIEERRLTLDERIQADVMDKLARNDNLSGKIGVETRDAVVTLTGYTSTSGQAYRAGREARSVIGVRYVENHIRPRVGGSI